MIGYPLNIDNCKLNDPPTEKQVSYVKGICDVLRIDPPEEYTKESYRRFISENKDDYEELCEYYAMASAELMFGLND